jgi:hypothetical protein
MEIKNFKNERKAASSLMNDAQMVSKTLKLISNLQGRFSF